MSNEGEDGANLYQLIGEFRSTRTYMEREFDRLNAKMDKTVDSLSNLEKIGDRTSEHAKRNEERIEKLEKCEPSSLSAKQETELKTSLYLSIVNLLNAIYFHFLRLTGQ